MPRPSIAPPLLTVLLLVLLARAAAAFTADEVKAPMTATLVRSDAAGCGADCPEWLALTGRITFDTPARLAAALARLGKRRVPVLLDSPGGESRAGLAMGRVIRARGLDTAVASTTLTACDAADRACADRLRAGEHAGHVGTPPGVNAAPACASACVFVLAGGTGRSVPPGAFVGVHQTKQVLTYHPVLNMFRVLSRVVDGRRVEISRTLLSTRPLPVRVVTGVAPQSLYSEFDRFLLGLGIDESIMPLMRATPPSGIHWLTPAELATTRIATDTTDARTLAARAAEPAPPGAGKATAMALAAAELEGGAPANGIVDWRVTRDGGAPVLVGTVDVPERHLHGTVALRRDTAPGGAGGFVATVDLGLPAAIEPGRLWLSEAPTICDGTECLPFFTPAVEVDDGQGKRQFRVRAAWGDSFLMRLEDRSRLLIPLSDGNAKGWVTASLTGNARTVVNAWEHLCCGQPLDARPQSPPAVLPSTPPLDGTATAFWTVLRDGSRPPQPGATFLLGSIEVPAAGLRLSLDAGLAPRGSGGGVVMALHLVPDIVRFGPATALTVEPVQASGRGIAMVGSARARALGGFDLALAVAAPLPRDATLALTMTDARGRELRVAVPMPGALWELLADARLLPS